MRLKDFSASVIVHSVEILLFFYHSYFLREINFGDSRSANSDF